MKNQKVLGYYQNLLKLRYVNRQVLADKGNQAHPACLFKIEKVNCSWYSLEPLNYRKPSHATHITEVVMDPEATFVMIYYKCQTRQALSKSFRHSSYGGAKSKETFFNANQISY